MDIVEKLRTHHWPSGAGSAFLAEQQKEAADEIEMLREIVEHVGGITIEQWNALVADAVRYRWLVENSFDREGVPQLHIWLHTWEPHSQTGEPTEWKQRVRGPAIDRAIDAAIGQAPNLKSTA